MFKKGQLLRSKMTNNIYLVEGPCRTSGMSYVSTLHGLAKGLHGTIEDRQVALIGNNYQAKPKCSR